MLEFFIRNYSQDLKEKGSYIPKRLNKLHLP